MNPGYVAEKDLGYIQITAVGAVTAVSLGTIPNGCSRVLIIPEGAAIRCRSDGTDPTATVGMPKAIGEQLDYTMGQMGQLKIIAQSGTAILNVQFMGQS